MAYRTLVTGTVVENDGKGNLKVQCPVQPASPAHDAKEAQIVFPCKGDAPVGSTVQGEFVTAYELKDPTLIDRINGTDAAVAGK
jgi:hypothetical protein